MHTPEIPDQPGGAGDGVTTPQDRGHEFDVAELLGPVQRQTLPRSLLGRRLRTGGIAISSRTVHTPDPYKFHAAFPGPAQNAGFDATASRRRSTRGPGGPPAGPVAHPRTTGTARAPAAAIEGFRSE